MGGSFGNKLQYLTPRSIWGPHPGACVSRSFTSPHAEMQSIHASSGRPFVLNAQPTACVASGIEPFTRYIGADSEMSQCAAMAIGDIASWMCIQVHAFLSISPFPIYNANGGRRFKRRPVFLKAQPAAGVASGRGTFGEFYLYLGISPG